MKKFFLLLMCMLMASMATAQELTKESKSLAKEEAKKFAKNDWKGAGADADLKEAFERAYVYIQDTLNYVVTEGAAKEIDAKTAIATATFIAQKKALEKAKEVLKGRGWKLSLAQDPINIITLYRDGKRRDDGSDGYVRVALKLIKKE